MRAYLTFAIWGGLLGILIALCVMTALPGYGGRTTSGPIPASPNAYPYFGASPRERYLFGITELVFKRFLEGKDREAVQILADTSPSERDSILKEVVSRMLRLPVNTELVSHVTSPAVDFCPQLMRVAQIADMVSDPLTRSECMLDIATHSNSKSVQQHCPDLFKNASRKAEQDLKTYYRWSSSWQGKISQIWEDYSWVVFCVLVSAFATSMVAVFTTKLVDRLMQPKTPMTNDSKEREKRFEQYWG